MGKSKGRVKGGDSIIMALQDTRSLGKRWDL